MIWATSLLSTTNMTQCLHVVAAHFGDCVDMFVELQLANEVT